MDNDKMLEIVLGTPEERRARANHSAVTRELRERLALVKREPVREVTISAEMAERIALALDDAAKFARHVPLYTERDDISAWADAVRTSSTDAAMRLRRVANLQSFAHSAECDDDFGGVPA